LAYSKTSQGKERAVVTTIVWILVGAALWLVIAVLVALLLGRVVRRRDEQVPPVCRADVVGVHDALTERLNAPPLVR
jgi:hypothetical protein